MSLVDTFANRSFRIRKKGRTNKQNPNLTDKKNLLARKFRASKKDPQIFVEKTKFAIDSRNELRQITFEGIKASKRAAAIRKVEGIKIKRKKKRTRRPRQPRFLWKKNGRNGDMLEFFS